MIDSVLDIVAALTVGFRENGWPAPDRNRVERFLGNGPRRLIADILDDLGIAHDEAAVERAFQGYQRAYLSDPAGRTRFFDHVPRDLAALRAAGARLGICTNKSHAVTGKILDQLGLSDLFDAVLGGDVVPACKPDARHLMAVAEEMGLRPGTWAYVGDTVVDRATAEAAEVPFYVVPWGGGPGVEVPPGNRLTRLADLLPGEGMVGALG